MCVHGGFHDYKILTYQRFITFQMAGTGGMFQFADFVDKLLMLFGTIGCIGDGLMSPLTLLILSGVIDEYGSSDLSFSMDVVDKVHVEDLFIEVSYCLDKLVLLTYVFL